MGRNPRTGEPAGITARRVVVFRPSAVLKKRIADGSAGGVDGVYIRQEKRRYTYICGTDWSRPDREAMMVRTSSNGIDEGTLTKGQRR